MQPSKNAKKKYFLKIHITETKLLQRCFIFNDFLPHDFSKEKSWGEKSVERWHSLHKSYNNKQGSCLIFFSFILDSEILTN